MEPIVNIPIRVLIIEDTDDDKELVLRHLKKGGYIPEYDCIQTREELVYALDNQNWDIILCDYSMPKFDGLTALQIVKQKAIDIPFILISGTVGEEIAVEAMKAGAQDYLMKDNLIRLNPIIKRELAESRIRNEKKIADEEIRNQNAVLDAIINNSHSIIIFMLDNEYRYVSFNENHRKAMKLVYNADIEMGMNMLNIINIPEIKKKAKASIDKVLSGESFIETEVQPNVNIYYEMHWNAVRKDEKIIGASCFTMDITERKKDEIELIKAKEEAEKSEKDLRKSEATVKKKLKAITDPEGDIGTLELSDIIDTEALQSVMDDFYQLTGMLGAILDLKGEILVAVGWQDICTKFHRCNADTLKNCIESDTILTQGVPEGTFKSYRCKNNLWDSVTPLMVGGKHLGNIFMGQYFRENEIPDVELFRNQAQQYGFDEKEYLAALDRVPHFSKEKLEAGMHFYAQLAEFISTLSFSSIQQSRMLTERTHAEEKIRATEENLKNTFDLSPSIIAKANMNEGRFIQVNKAVTKILGYSIDEFTSRPYMEFVHLDDRQSTIDIATEQLKGNEVTFFENRYLCKDGSYKWMAWHGTKPDDDGVVTTIGSDINARKQAEIELIAAKEKAEESDRLKSAFLANMSHEIRTPMNGILGFSSLLKEPKLSGEQQKKYIDIIEKSGVRMLNIINDIIDISKIEAGLMTMDITESDINEQLEYIYTFFKPEVEAKGMKLSLKDTLSSNDAIIKTDREKVFAILTNLVKNAIKYSDNGFIEMGYSPKGDVLEFFVKDTGIGIPKDRQESVFERFIQADIDDKMARQGAGLGLAITKAYVEMLGGSIWVESQEENLPANKEGGSTFYFTLPYNSFYKKEASHENNSGANLKFLEQNLEILIVEDDESSAILLEIMVENINKNLIKAKTGLEAIEAYKNNPDIDLILMDIQLPGMNGYEVTRKIREFNKEVIIIAQTAYGLSGEKERAIKAGCNDYISKPIKQDELLALVQKYFKK